MYDVQLLGDLGGQFGGSIARDINNAGQVVGFASSRVASIEAFYWDADNGMQGLGVHQGSDVFPNSAVSIASTINNLGQITGAVLGPSTGFIGERL